ncbi:hypothetical protein Tco_0839045 [Tanacetum coccineum]|uniref:Uncharacterized protein n=1 Tax=Tanacetum coccineum TaxID=301880 RepID=A0ABQ5AQD1_9ASTR
MGDLSAAKVLADAAKKNIHTYTRRRRVVSTGSAGGISTAGASMPVSTTGMVQEVNISIPSPIVVKGKGKGKMEESEDKHTKRTKLQQEQEMLGHEAAVRLQEELDEEERQMMARVHEASQSFLRKNGKTLKQELKLMKSYLRDYKDAEAELDHKGSKRQKTNEASGSVQEQLEEEEKELSQEDLQQMMMEVPIIRVGNHTEAYQFFEDMLKIFDRDDLVMLWNLVKERFSSTEPTDDKEITLWVEMKRLFEPNTDDTLWKLQRYMHDPLKWRLYDTCGVHHVSTERGIDIFMLVEKEYPLSKGVLTLMLVNKLLVEQHSEMANELLRKIFIQANRPRQ